MMDRTTSKASLVSPTGPLVRFAILACLAYLGFYVYGLVMGVFSPGEMVGFSSIAAGILITCGVYAMFLRREPVESEERRKMLHDLHEQQRRRGF